ncbi:hypothetical protein P3T39_007449 [Kitasatospora sp. GP82]|nr:hypothetical protein [Kitasatospora sp. GP82]
MRRADQIELVDMSAEALRRRMVHGNIYPPEKIDAALASFFRAGNLTALREIALLWAADRVEEALLRYRHEADLRPRIAARLARAEQRAAELEAFTACLRDELERLDALPDREDRCDAECEPLAPPTSNTGTAGQEGERWRTAAVACSLTRDGLAERTTQWHQVLDGATRIGIPDGLRLTLPAERTTAVASLAAAEQRCCPFFDFRLHLDGPAVHLEVRAGHDGMRVLADLFGPTDRAPTTP